MFHPRNVDLVNQYIVNMETQTMKDAKRVSILVTVQLRAKDFPPNHTWFNSEPLSLF